MKNIPDYENFAKDVLNHFFDGEHIDGFEIQDLALKYYLCNSVNVTERCSDDCLCAECGFPAECIRKNF